MSVYYPLANYAGYQFPPAGPAAGVWTDVTLEAGSIKQDPNSAFNASSTWGETSQIDLNNVDPGNMNGALPDLALLQFLIADPFDYDDNVHIVLQFQFTGCPTSQWLIYLGLYDGTVATNHGLYGALRSDNGGTGAQTMGAQPTFGQAAASFQANGGSLSTAFSLDPLGTPNARGNFARSYSATGPAWGRTERTDNPTSWAGTALYGFLGFGATGTRDAGTVADVKMRYQVIPRWPA